MAADYLDKLNPDGTIFGQGSTSATKIGFFGKTARIRITAIQSISAAETTANLKTRVRLILTGLKNLGLVG